jgi:hypothetical protein
MKMYSYIKQKKTVINLKNLAYLVEYKGLSLLFLNTITNLGGLRHRLSDECHF